MLFIIKKKKTNLPDIRSIYSSWEQSY